MHQTRRNWQSFTIFWEILHFIFKCNSSTNFSLELFKETSSSDKSRNETWVKVSLRRVDSRTSRKIEINRHSSMLDKLGLKKKDESIFNDLNDSNDSVNLRDFLLQTQYTIVTQYTISISQMPKNMACANTL